MRGKRILLTGASSGIGAVAAQKLAAEGAMVIAVARRESLLAGIVEQITASGGNATAIRPICPISTTSTPWLRRSAPSTF